MLTRSKFLCSILATTFLAAYTQTPPTSAERAAQRTQSNIKLVERDYYTLPYGLQLTVLADAARKQNGQVDANLLQQPLTDATMNVVLTDISAGQTARYSGPALGRLSYHAPGGAGRTSHRGPQSRRG